jgi:hypothetical protein
LFKKRQTESYSLAMRKQPLVAFHDDPKIKTKYLERLAAHRKAGAFVSDIWWDGHLKIGCAVGCTIHSENLDLFETELGIPASVAWLEARIHGKLLGDRLDRFAEEVLEAITPGHDLSLVAAHFVYWLLTSPSGPRGKCSSGDVALFDQVIALYVQRINEGEPSKMAWETTGYMVKDALAVSRMFGEEINAGLLADCALRASREAKSIWNMLGYVGCLFSEEERGPFWGRMADRFVEILKSCERRRMSPVLVMKKREARVEHVIA